MKRTLLYVCVLVVSFFAFSAILHSTAYAATTDNIAGWAWSSNIGWISLNCTNEVGSCASSNYGVTKDNNGYLTGYAWSSSLGWIQFGGFVSGFPTGTSTYSQDAQIVGSSVRGWAKAIAADGSGGYDGWISLSGASPTYGVSLTGTAFSGYAWGNTIIGWISFNCTNDSTCGTVNYGVQLTGDASFDVQNGGVTLSGNGAVPYGTIPTFIWTVTNLPSVSCAITKTSPGGTSMTSITGITASGTSTTSSAGLVNTSYTYSLDCTNPTISKQISFTVSPQPASFSLGGSGSALIQFVNAGVTESVQDLTNVTAFGGFSNSVSISITGFPTPPASTTYAYSFNGGTSYSASPAAFVINSPYSTGLPFKIKVTRLTGAPAITDPFIVTLTGVGAGAPNSTKDITITPVTFNPLFENR